MEFVKHVSVPTPERVPVEYEIANVGSRAVAQLVDVFALAGMVFTFFVVFGLGLSILPRWTSLPVLIVAGAAAPFAYFILFEWLTGATPGKMAMRVRVVTDAGTPIGLRESAVRNVLRVIDILPTIYVLGGTVAACSDRGKRLGDMAAGTFCVRTEPRRRGRTYLERTQTSFVDQVESRTPEMALAADLLSVSQLYVRRRHGLDPEVRAELAGELAERLGPHVERRQGSTDENYVIESERKLRLRV